MTTNITATESVTIESVALRGKGAEALKALISARALKAQAEAQESEARATLLALLKDKGAVKAHVQGHSVVLRTETRNTIDSKGLRETYPEIAQAFTNTATIEKLVTR